MTHADPVWVNVEDDESSVSSARIIDQEASGEDGSSDVDDEHPVQLEPIDGPADDVDQVPSRSAIGEHVPAGDVEMAGEPLQDA